MSRKSNEFFKWTDNEVELLLRVTQEYKVAKASENIDWETCQNKYTEILDRLKEQYPADDTAYPHSKDDLTKLIITTKLKAIRLKYRHAVDSGKRSGHGRVVLLYFELCEQIWGGSPAVTTIGCGIETSDINSHSSTTDDSYPPSVCRDSTSPSPCSSAPSPATASQDSDTDDLCSADLLSSLDNVANCDDALIKGWDACDDAVVPNASEAITRSVVTDKPSGITCADNFVADIDDQDLISAADSIAPAPVTRPPRPEAQDTIIDLTHKEFSNDPHGMITDLTHKESSDDQDGPSISNADRRNERSPLRTKRIVVVVNPTINSQQNLTDLFILQNL
ncbi:tripartite motif-containing 16-like protein [Labeo rohita]|uniref:Tripartite motif-containing 16-like protein n=1 Tax=Labeo rohita TaxID=84645 RepID=A0A498M1G2_LABRO|nr:tripartite motif-containing 16-like protein [Labeo rohita]